MNEFLLVSIFILFGVISPGLDFALVSRNSLCYSQRAGIMTALGIAVGTIFHASYCILGFTLIISHSLLLFNIIKYLSAAYLIYLGVKGFLEKRSITDFDAEKSQQDMSVWQAFQQGFVCNALNPQVVYYFIVLFTTMIKPTMSLGGKISYETEIFLVHFLWFIIIATIFSHAKIKSILGKLQYYITKIFGVILMLFGLHITFMAH